MAAMNSVMLITDGEACYGGEAQEDRSEGADAAVSLGGPGEGKGAVAAT